MPDVDLERISTEVSEALEAGEGGRAAQLLGDLHAADVGHILESMDEEGRVAAFRLLSIERAADVLGEMEEESRQVLLERLSNLLLARVISRMDSDEAADVVGDLSEPSAEAVLAEMAPEEAAEIRGLAAHGEETAAGIMATEFASVPAEVTVGEALETLRREYRELEEMYFVHVTDAEGKLVGSVSLRDLVLADPPTKVGELAESHRHWVEAHADQEEVVRRMTHYGLVAVPVVDERGRPIGEVSVDDALEVMEEEATEDLFRMAGLDEEERVLSSAGQSLKRRLPWLLVNLGTAFVAANVVNLFEGSIAELATLAVLMPMVAGLGGNSGTQTLALFVRALALGELDRGTARRAIAKEVLLAAVKGLAIGMLLGMIAYLWKGNAGLAVVAGAAMLLNMLAAGMAGALVPLLLRRLKLDPALGSGVVVTAITDSAGFFFFLGLATLFLVR